MRLLFIFGAHAAGKMTVGQAVSRVTPMKLFHNHMTIEPVIELFGQYNGAVTERLRQVVFEEFVKTDNYGLIFTFIWAFDMPYDEEYVKRLSGMYRAAGAEVDYVELIAPQDVRLVRNRTENRLKPGEKPDRKASFQDDCWPPLEIKGLNPKIDIEDHSMLLMQLDNGVQASYEQCMYAPDNERNYTFIGTKGRVENIGDYHGDTYIHVWTQRGFRKDPDIIYHIKLRSGTHGGSDADIVNVFFDFLLEGRAPEVSPVAARNAVAAGVMGHYSMRNGNVPGEIPPLRPELIEYFENGQKKQK